MLSIALTIAKENKARIEKMTCSRGMEIIFEKLMEKFGAKLGEISIAELEGFRTSTVYAYETVIENE